MSETQILVEINDDGAARLSWGYGGTTIPAEVAAVIFDPATLRSKGVAVECPPTESHEKAQRQHAARMQAAGDRSNDAFMLAGRR